MGVFPKQKISRTERTPEWWKQNVDYFISQSSFAGKLYTEMQLLLRAADGYLDKAAYNYVLNPRNVEDENLTHFPAKLRNYDIIKPVIAAFMGEQSKKPANCNVIVLNSDVENKYTAALEQAVEQALQQEIINTLNENGVETGLPSQQAPDPQQVAQQHKENWGDDRAARGQESIDYIKQFCDLDDKFQQLYYFWKAVGRVITYKGVHMNDVQSEVVHPLDFWFMPSSNSPYIEDSAACVYRKRMNINDIIDKYREKLKPADIDWLESQANSISAPPETNGFVYIGSQNMDMQNSWNYGAYRGGIVDVYHICWKSFRQVGILTYQNELREQLTTEVNEDYVLDTEKGDISIRWEWINEWLEDWRIGTQIYPDGQVGEVQRDELSNSSICKLPYNGIFDITISGEIQSDVKRGLVYQALYNVYHYKRELTINRNKDKIMMMPIGLLPKEFGKNKMDKFMYQVEASSVAWFDETKPNASAVMQALKAIDMNLYQYLEGMTKVINEVKNEWWDCVGMNRQRFGDTMASDGKSVNEQAIFRGSIITAESNRRFNKFREKEYDGLLDYSKVAWLDGKKGMFINSDRRRAFLNINGTEHLETDYRVFCVDAEQEEENLKTIKSITLQTAQKAGVKNGLIAEIIGSNNFARLKEISAKVDDLETQMEQASAQAQQAHEKELAQNERDMKQIAADASKYAADKHYEAIVDAATIAAEAKGVQAMADSDANGQPDFIEQDKNNIEREKMANDLVIEQKKADLKREELASKEKIARMKPKTTK